MAQCDPGNGETSRGNRFHHVRRGHAHPDLGRRLDEVRNPLGSPSLDGPHLVRGELPEVGDETSDREGHTGPKLTAEAIVGNYYIDVLQGWAGGDATDGHFWNPALALKRIFEDLAIPEAERTYALSIYLDPKCLNPGSLPGNCVDADAHAWADETFATVRDIVGNTSRVVAAEFGLFEPQSADWPKPEHALREPHHAHGATWRGRRFVVDVDRGRRGDITDRNLELLEKYLQAC